LSRYLQNWKDEKAKSYVIGAFTSFDNEQKQQAYLKIKDLYSANSWIMDREVEAFLQEYLLLKDQEVDLIGNLENLNIGL